MYKITFSNVADIRMGSPYNVADIKVEGGYFPEVSRENSFQDKYAISSNGEICFAVVWDTSGNEPGFRVWKVSNLEKTVKVSGRISGCCDEISALPNEEGVQVVIWEHPKGKRTEKISVFY